ncbi:MAG TPA: transporter [Pyrinomonadaceae bacterium]|nr:transporter [Pyrinomonadaceae bacterium]
MKRHILFYLSLLAILLVANVTIAQERGQYIPGFRGLNPAEQPGAGFTYLNFFYWYPTSTLKDRDGSKANTNFDLDLVADINLFAYTPKKKFLGATYTASIAIPVMNAAITLPKIGANTATGASFGDIYIEPLSLSWAFKKGKVRAAYGFMPPSGAKRVTSNYLGHQISFGGTYHPDKHGLWQISAHSVWELHHKKRNEDVKVGNNVTFEYGVGKTFVKNMGAQIYQLGLVGYAQMQLTQDTGTAVVPFNVGAKDRVFAVGPEFDVILPKKKINFFVRVLPEFGARSRTQGVTVMTGIGKTF